MTTIQTQCDTLQNHIKKAKSNLTTFMYTPGGLTFIIMLPFVYLHKKHFKKVEEGTERLNSYLKDQTLNIEFEKFCESQNSAVIYNQAQMGSLTANQHEAKLKYLDTLNDKVEAFKQSL